MNKKRVRLEPELEQIAGDLGASQRKDMANKLRRWVKQLEFSSLILELDSAPKPPPVFRPLPRSRLRLN